MSAGDALAFVFLAAAGYLAMQAAPASAAALPAGAQPAVNPISGIAQNAVNNALLGAGLLALPAGNSGISYGEQFGPFLPSPAVGVGTAAVTAGLTGAGLAALGGINYNLEATVMKPGYISPKNCKALAQRLIAAHGFNVNANLVTAIAICESGDLGNPQNGCNPQARRYEQHLGVASTGIMQVLTSTARWLAQDMGYKAKGLPVEADLYTPETGMYFGLAYLHYLRNWNGRARDDLFVIQGYNAGPSNKSAAYLEKVNRALLWVRQNLGG